jgi:phosphoesterase RecJ-like protein
MKEQNTYEMAYNKIKEAKKILAIWHVNPDGDSIGSCLGFKYIVEKSCFFKKVDILCNDKISEKYHFLPWVNKIKNNANIWSYDLVVFLDCSDETRAESDNFSFDKKQLKNVINIDHHYTNTNFWNVNIVDSTFSSATAILYDFATKTGLKVDKKAWLCLLTWIYSDTLGFKNANVLDRTYKIAWEIVKLGVDTQIIIKNLFKNNNVNKLKAWWRVLSNCFIDWNNVLNWFISHEEMMMYWVELWDISPVVSILNECEGVNYSMLLSQNWENIKGSLRTVREDVDLTEVASKYGWWGHKRASGFTVKWKLKVKTTISID